MESKSSHLLSTRVAAAAVLAVLAFVTPVASFAKVRPTPTPTASPTPPPEDPAVGRVAKREFVSWQAGNVDHTRYTAELNSKLSDVLVSKTATGLGHLGAFVRSEYLGPVVIEDAPKGISGYLYRMFCTNGAVYERLVLDASGKIAGIYFMDKLPTADQ